VDIEIRQGGVEDFEVFNRLIREVHRLHVQHSAQIFREPEDGVIFSKGRLDEILADAGAALFLAEAGGDAVGFALVMLRLAPDAPMFVPRTFAMVDSIGVSEAYQSRGIGKSLMTAVGEWAQERGAASIELSVHAFNHQAIRFYESLGFSTYLLRMEKRIG
jgi:ribosomal protein S18 acetylase RimI-like enzyme